MALVINKDKKETATAPKQEEVKVEATATATEEGKNYGSDRKNLAFVCPLGDPSNPDTTKVVNPDGSEGRKITSTIVGYRFKVLADMKVPNCGTNENFKNDPMNYDNVDAWIDVKAGTEVNLTPFETALLLSGENFNGGCDGGEKPVSCVYQFKTPKSKSGVAKASAVQAAPRVSLRAATGSIKDFAIEDVLTFVKKEVNGVVRKERTIKPGFEKWAPLAAVATRKSTGRSGKVAADPTTTANKNAQMFLQYVKARKGAK